MNQMEKTKLYSRKYTDEDNRTYHLEYSLIAQPFVQATVYGVEILLDHEKREYVEGLCENREEAEGFLRRLADGLAFPVELAALSDDFISEREYEKELKNMQAAS